MTIESFIRKTFPEGLEYDDAAQLCLLLYCSNVLPEALMSQCTKEHLPTVFSQLVKTKFVNLNHISDSARYGANLHDPNDRGHWVEVILSIFKIGNMIDPEKRKRLTKEFTCTS